MAENVFVLGLDAHNAHLLHGLPDADRYRFHPLLSDGELACGESVDLPGLLNAAQRQVEAFGGPVHAVVGFWDFPVSTMVPILCARLGLRWASVESVVKCEHKYWSRVPRVDHARAAGAARPRRRRAAVARSGEPEAARPIATTPLVPGRERWVVTRDLADYAAALEVVKDLGVVRFDGIDLELTRRADERYSCVGDDVGSVRGEVEWTMGFARGDWAVETRTRTVLTSTATDFRLHAQLDAYEGDERVFAHSWRLALPRDHL